MSFQPPLPGLGVLSTHQDLSIGIQRCILEPASLVDDLALPFALRASVANVHRYTACELAYLRWYAVFESLGEVRAEAVRKALLAEGQVVLAIPANGLPFRLPPTVSRLLGEQDCKLMCELLRDQVFVVPASEWSADIVDSIEADGVVSRMRGREELICSYRERIEQDATALAKRFSR